MTPEETLRQALLKDKFPETDAKPIVPIADPLKYNRMTAASAWMENLTGRSISPEDIGWPAEKDAFVQEFFKMPEARDVSDETVHDLIRSHIQTSDNATDIALNSALSGRPFSETLNEIQALTGVSKTRGIRDRYVNAASSLYSNIASKRAQYNDVINDASASLGNMLKREDTDIGMTDVFNAAAEKIINVPAEDRRFVIEAIAATGGATAEERSSYLSKIEAKVNRMAETLGAASASNLSTALESVLDLAAFGSGLADPRDVASAAPENNQSRELSLLAQQIRTAAYEKLDPIKSNSWLGEKGLALAEMGTQSSVGLINPLAAFAVNLAYFNDSIAADAMTQNPGMTVEQADSVTNFAAPINAAWETVTALIPFGKVKLPFLQKWIMAETASIGGTARNFVIRSTAGTATEIGEEWAQAYTPLKVQELMRAMGQDMPAVDWERNMPKFADIAAEVWAPALVFSIVGAGAASISDINNGRSLAADLDLLIAKGIAPETAAKIKEASDAGNYQHVDGLFRQEFDSDVKASKSDIQAATDRLKARFRDQSSMDVLQDVTSPEYTAKVIRTPTEWQVQTGDGKVITTETKETADQIYNNIRQVGNQKEAEVITEILNEFYTGGMGRGAQVEMTGETVGAAGGSVFAIRRDAGGAPIAGSARAFDEKALEEVRAEAAAAGFASGTQDVFARINGSNEIFPQQVGDTAKGIWRILSLFESRQNATPQVATLLHEDIESKFKLGLINGSWKVGDIQKAFAGLLPAFANITAPVTLTDEQIAKMSARDQEAYYAKQSEFNWISNVRKIVDGNFDAAMLRETFSEMYVRDRFALDRKGRATGLPAGLISKGIEAAVMGAKTQEEASIYKRFRAMFKAFSAHFKAVFKTVQTMVAARKEGKIGEDWDSFVNKVLGIDEVKQMEGQTIEEVKAMLGVDAETQAVIDAGNMPFSISRAQPADTSNITEMPDGAQLVGPTTFSITAYHGTPYQVDRFRMAKIGTGEGAQAFGWGLYFAKARKVAEQYRKDLSGFEELTIYTKDGKKKGSALDDVDLDAAKYLESGARAAGQFKHNTVYYAKQQAEAAGKPDVVARIESYGRDVKVGYEVNRGNLYTVELLPDEEDFLDWDKPIAGQKNPKLEALKKQHRAFLQDPAQRISDKGKNGDSLYNMVVRQKGSEKAASEYLASLGIPGIRYLDGSSRAAGEGTSNYVIFDESLVKILEENGQKVEGPTFSISPVSEEERITPENKVAPSINGKPAADIFAEVKKRHGITRSIYEAGYVLPDGTMLDFTGRADVGDFKQGPDLVFRVVSGRDWMKDQRGVDHREIEWQDMPDYQENWERMVGFLRLGAVRVDARSGMISMHSRAKITAAQASVLKSIVVAADGAYIDLEDDARNRSSMQLNGGKWGKVNGLLTRWANGETPEFEGQSFSISPVTPAQDAEHLAAVESGDTAKAQAVVDEAAKRVGGIQVFHGTKSKSAFNKFDRKDVEDESGAFFFSETRSDAGKYGTPKGFFIFPKSILDLTDLSKPESLSHAEKIVGRTVEARKVGRDTWDIANNNEIQYYTGENGFDAFSVLESGNVNYGIFDPSQIKSADPVTYDNAGNVIPLSQRFNPETPNINFSISPIRNLNELSDQVERNFAENPVGALEVKSKVIRQFAKLADKWSQERWTPQGNKIRPISEKRTVKSLDKEQAMRQATLEGEKIAANMEAGQALQQAKAEAQAWRDETDAMQKEDWSPRESLVRDLITLEAIVAMFPAEIRGKIGGFVALARKASEAARLKVLQKQLERGQVLLEKHLKDQYNISLLKMLDSAAPVGKPGEIKKSKFIVTVQDELDAISEMVGMDSDDVTEAITTNEAAIISAQTPEAADAALTQLNLLELFGGILDLKNTSSQEMEVAHEYLAKLMKQGRDARKMIDEARSAKVKEMVATAKDDAFKGTTGPETTQAAKAEAAKKSGKAMLKKFFNELSGFDAVLRDAFGPKSKTATEFSNRFTLNSNDFEDVQNERRTRFRDFARELYRTKLGALINQKLIGLERIEKNSGVTYLKNREVKIHKFTEADAAKIVADPKAFGFTDADATAISDEIQAIQNSGGRRKVFTYEQIINDGDRVEIPLSQMNAVYLSMALRQPGILEQQQRFGYDQQTVNELDKYLSDEAKAWRRWMQTEYDSEYQRANEVYMRMFNARMPMIMFYAPLLKNHQGMQAILDPLNTGISSNSANPGSIKSRKSNTSSLRIDSALSVFWSHFNQMEYWITNAEYLRDIQAVLLNPEVRESVVSAHGEDGMRTISAWVQLQMSRGVGKAALASAGDEMFRNVKAGLTMKALALSYTTALKTLPSVFYSLGEIHMSKWPAALVSGMKHWDKIWKTNIIQRRLDIGGMPELRDLGSSAMPMSWINQLIKYGSYPAMYADGVFTTFSAAMAYGVNYDEAKRQGASDALADKHAEERTALIVSRTAQPENWTQKSLRENDVGVFGSMFTLFMSDPRQKMALTGEALNQWRKGSATSEEAMRKFLAYWIIPGIMFQLANAIGRSLFKGDDDEWEVVDFATAALVGQFQGLVLLGSGVEMIFSAAIAAAAEKITGEEVKRKPFWNSPKNPLDQAAQDLIKSVKSLDDTDKDGFRKAWEMIKSIGMLSSWYSPAGAIPATLERVMKDTTNLFYEADQE